MSSTIIGEDTSSSSDRPDERARRFLTTLGLRAAADRLDNESFVPEDFLKIALSDDEPVLPRGRTFIRPDIAAAAILLARCIDTVPNFPREVRHARPIVTIATGRPDLVEPIGFVFRHCVLSCSNAADQKYRRRRKASEPALFVKRDGADHSQKPESGNDLIKTAVFENRPIIGIASVPASYLPSDLVRAADFALTIGSLDNVALSLIVETVTGKAPTAELPPGLAAQADMSDLCLAIRTFDAPDKCILRLQSIVKAKQVQIERGPGLEDLPGYGPAKEWGLNLASDLRAYKAGSLPWASIDRGLLLDGPPGVGKTQFAKALARSAGVPLVASSVAQWNATTHLGATLVSMKSSFNRALTLAPCILFIDELDGISDRSRLEGEHVEYWSQIVNLFLELLSGVEDRPGVVVVAASNHCERIDPAVRRAGRLDRTITISSPGIEELVEIFRFHLGADLPTSDLTPLALAARGRTGADVEAYVRRARSNARRCNRRLRLDDVKREIGGGQSLPRMLKRAVSVHEAGHVVVGTALRTTPEMVCLTATGGLTMPKFGHDVGYDLFELEKEISILLAGYAAEKLLHGSEEITYGSGTGDTSDLAKATQVAFDIEAKYGLGDCGLMRLPDAFVTARYHDPLVQAAIQRRLNRCLEQAESVLRRNEKAALAIADALHENGYLDEVTITRILSSHGLLPAA